MSDNLFDNYGNRLYLLLALPTILTLSFCDLPAQAHDWELVDFVDNLDYRDIKFADSLHGMAAGNWAEYGRPTIRRTKDGGNTWESVLELEITRDVEGNFVSLPTRFHAISHPTSQIAIAVGDSGTMYRSYDGGDTWDYLDFGFDENFRDISMSDELNGIASSEKNLVFQTTDGGKNWNQVYIPQNLNLFDIAFFNGEEVIWKAVKNDDFGFHVAKLNLANDSWKILATPYENGQLYFVTPLQGWLVGFDAGNDKVHYTTDGGETWNSALDEQIDPPFGLISINFVDENHGIAGGLDGKILRTYDGGKTWIVDNSADLLAAYQAVNRVEYINPDLAFAVGNNGYIVRYEARTTSVDDKDLMSSPNAAFIYPNPAGQKITVSTPWHCADKYIELFDITGRVIIAAGGLTGDEESLDVSTLPPGVYHVHISGCGESSAQKIVISR